jgi:hypothetical protein
MGGTAAVGGYRAVDRDRPARLDQHRTATGAAGVIANSTAAARVQRGIGESIGGTPVSAHDSAGAAVPAAANPGSLARPVPLVFFAHALAVILPD